ncbi:YfbM family protein [Dactylosporangium aurantiacum]|uniref:YfbM family protein n=1 Tax=Dactylosporangium aurantiacum TaxID=35754 RepID=A0A9Q9IEI6_9ACTN|nr:YfbM family protein [Dactylosporangium aurantiacum]MDG6105235.1 YfbM family protein [Dactylosporangium aurantiacum]UWZ51748.1 YfbM family protein [Dactylosporangium aurantiacum]
MGMDLIGRRLSAGELRAVLADPAAVDELLYGDLDDDEADMPEPELDLDRSWHVVHFLLTGTAWEVTQGAGEAVLGGVEIGEDGGYGPARLLDAATVRRIAAALDTLDVDALCARFDPAAMTAADLYPDTLRLGPGDVRSFLDPYLADLRRFYATAATNGEAVLLAIT